jgi:hypothetical protein
MSQNSTPNYQVLPYGGYVSTNLVYQSVSYQNAANSVFYAKSTIDAANLQNVNTQNLVVNFKSYDEKMKYLIGKLGVGGYTK